MRFFDQLAARAKQQNTLLCVGLDPRPERFSAEIAAQEDPIFAFNRGIIDATHDLICAYKPNYAFYEAHGPQGLRALRRTVEYIGDDIPVVLDAKRGDIGSTSAALAHAAFDIWGAGAVTVAPYLGSDSITPFTAYADRGVFVLCHTSNPGASELQTLTCAAEGCVGGEPLHLRVARLSQGWSETDNVGLVVGATYPGALQAVRAVAPQTWFLVPGIGTQGGDLQATIAAGLRADGLGVVINVSRAVCHADDPRSAARRFRDQINEARAQLASQPNAGGRHHEGSDATRRHTNLVLDLARIGAVRFGEFTLKSGNISPLYIDLRLLASYPDVLGRAAAAYAEVLQGLTYDRIAAIPYAALPIGTAVALQTGKPLIYPRKEVKGYGTRRAIEGTYTAGERTVVLDDLITTGGSKIEAIAPLQEAGLEVQDVVVLIDRESGGQQALAKRGLCLHSVLGLRLILDVLSAHGSIDQAQKALVLNWLAEQ